MLMSYLRVTLNSFLNNKLYSLINIVGLAVGLASVILIGLYVVDEFSYDEQWADSDRLWRISRDFYATEEAQEAHLATSPGPVAGLMKENFEMVEETARLYSVRGLLVNRENNTSFFENNLRFIDASFFELFDFEWLQGDPAAALESPVALIITESTARRYFGTERAVGRTLWLENNAQMQVTGVIADIPPNSHLSGSIFFNLEGLLNVIGREVADNWNANMFHTYVRLEPGADMEVIRAQFPDFLNRHLREDASDWTGLTPYRVTDIHLRSNRQLELSPPGSLNNVVTLTLIAFGILFIACFNFMNLSTARSELRSKEVGVRKTIGSRRSHLILQFLGESMFMTLLATLVAIVLVEMLLPVFNGFTGKTLALNVLGDGRVLMLLVSLVLTVGGIAGSYPAFYLSSFKAAQVLRSKVRASMADVMFRNLLVVLQFSISITLVVATAVVFMQTRYARNIDLGFNKEQVVILEGGPAQGLGANWEAMRRELERHPDILSVTASNLVPGMENLTVTSARAEGSQAQRDLASMFIDYDFFETYQIELLNGRLFSRDFPSDLSSFDGISAGAGFSNLVINEAAARSFGWSPETALDKVLILNNQSQGRIVGVVADSHFESVRFAVKPVVFRLVPVGIGANNSASLPNASVRISGRNMEQTLAHIDNVWEEQIPFYPIDRSFLDDRFEALYSDETRLGQLFSAFAVLATIIACLGLFGLASFNTQRRTKEIGVRKVMGGSVWSIVLLLTNDFSKLVLISNVIAWPLAYVAMQRWLENFAYRIDLTPLIFIGSGLIALCVAWVTVGGTAAKAASAKPVLALRYE